MSNVNDLLTAIANRDFDQDEIQGDIDFVNERFDKFRKYFNAVYEHVYGSSTALTLIHGGMMSVEKYQDKVMRLDRNRKEAHDMAIKACAQINRQCDMYGLDHLCPEVEIDTRDGNKCTNRDEIGDFVGRYMYSVFQQGREDRNMEPIEIDDNTKYGNRSAIDISYDMAREAGRNPESAYSSDDIDQDAYEDFTYDMDSGSEEFDCDEDFGEL